MLVNKLDHVCPYCGTTWIYQSASDGAADLIEQCYCDELFTDAPSDREKRVRATELLKKREALLEADYQRLLDLLTKLHVEKPEQLAKQVFLAYSEPHRVYHNIDHIRFCLAQYDMFVPEPSPWQEAAIWLHDVVYRPGYSSIGDEELSAAWAAARLCSKGAPYETKIYVLILATDHSQLDNSMGDYVADVDLAVLGTTRFDEYERKIRQEFKAVDDCKYSKGRAEFLQKFLASRPERIYRTDVFYDRYENAARENISKLLTRLNEVD